MYGETWEDERGVRVNCLLTPSVHLAGEPCAARIASGSRSSSSRAVLTSAQEACTSDCSVGVCGWLGGLQAMGLLVLETRQTQAFTHCKAGDSNPLSPETLSALNYGPFWASYIQGSDESQEPSGSWAAFWPAELGKHQRHVSTLLGRVNAVRMKVRLHPGILEARQVGILRTLEERRAWGGKKGWKAG